jgi:hypothetical protein
VKPLGEAAARVVERLAQPTDPDRVAEKAICDFLPARGIDILEHSGSLYVCGQFWSRNRVGGRTITSVNVSVTDMGEEIITALQLSQR